MQVYQFLLNSVQIGIINILSIFYSNLEKNTTNKGRKALVQNQRRKDLDVRKEAAFITNFSQSSIPFSRNKRDGWRK